MTSSDGGGACRPAIVSLNEPHDVCAVTAPDLHVQVPLIWSVNCRRGDTSVRSVRSETPLCVAGFCMAAIHKHAQRAGGYSYGCTSETAARVNASLRLVARRRSLRPRNRLLTSQHSATMSRTSLMIEM